MAMEVEVVLPAVAEAMAAVVPADVVAAAAASLLLGGELLIATGAAGFGPPTVLAPAGGVTTE
jgi:hypothetical protein